MKITEQKVGHNYYFIYLFLIGPSKKNTFLVRIAIKKESGRAVLFVIYYFLLHAFFTHITFPQGYVGALRSNINKTKHQILIKHKFV